MKNSLLTNPVCRGQLPGGAMQITVNDPNAWASEHGLPTIEF